MIVELEQAEAVATVPEGGQHLAPGWPSEVEVVEPLVPRPLEEIEHRAFGRSFGPSLTAPSRADPRQAVQIGDKPDEFGGILPSQVHCHRPGGRCRILLAAVLQATAADLGRGGDCRAEALRWIRYCRAPGDRSLGFTLGEICERLDLNVESTRERLVAIEVDLSARTRRGRTASTVAAKGLAGAEEYAEAGYARPLDQGGRSSS